MKFRGIILLMVLAVISCGRDSTFIPWRGGGVPLAIRLATAPRAPVVGPVDSLWIILRGPGGELLTHPTIVDIEPGQTEFTASLEVPPGDGRSITVLAFGSRPVSGGASPTTSAGILYFGRADDLNIVPGQVPTVEILLSIFVPEFNGVEQTNSTPQHVINWTPVAGAEFYRLTQRFSRSERETVVVGTSFTGRQLPVMYQVRAVEFSGKESARSDIISLSQEEVPLLCLSPDSLNFGLGTTSLTLSITNCGGPGAALLWTLSEEAGWLFPNSLSGSTTGMDVVTLLVDREGLDPGHYETRVAVSSNGGEGTALVQMDVASRAQLCVSPPQLDFGELETAQSFGISNCTATGTVNWTCTPDQPWMIVTPALGSTTTETDPVFVNVNRAGLSPGIYTGMVNVMSNVGPGEVMVRMVVQAVPQLCSSPVMLEFGPGEVMGRVTIRNCGTGGTLTWTAVDDMAWLSVTPMSGTATTETDSVTVTVNRSGLAPGDYQGLIDVTSNGGAAGIMVRMQVAAEPALCVSATSLDFGATDVTRTFNITNCGSGGTVTWTAAGDPSWLSVSPPAGTTTTEADPVTVTVDRAGLSPGDYSGTVIVASDHGSAAVEVTMSVPGRPAICAAPELLVFGRQEVSLTATVRNCGNGGRLDWSASTDEAWLSIAPGSGSSTTETDEILVTVDRTGLPPDTYMGSVDFTSNAGDARVPVTLIVEGEVELCVVPLSLDFGEAEIERILTIRNCGFPGEMSWFVSWDQPWLSASPLNGSVTDETDEVTVSVNRFGLAPGAYEGMLTVASDGGDASIPVTMVVEDQPALCVQPEALSFAGTESVKTLTITNCGGPGTLTWSVGTDQPWLSAIPGSGSTTTEADIITVSVDRSNLDPGFYNGLITVLSSGGDVVIPVSMAVDAMPQLCVDEITLDFGTSATQRTFNILNCGQGGTLTWEVGDDQPYITLSPTSGSTTTEADEITVTVSRAGLPSGTYGGNITVTSNGGKASLNVIMQVSPSAPPAPAAPSDVRGVQSSAAFAIQVTWKDNATNEAWFVVERRNSTFTPWTIIADGLPPNTTGFLDTQINCFSRFQYRVSACNSGGCGISAPSAFVSVLCVDEP